MESYLEVFLKEIKNQTICDKLEVYLDLNSPTKRELDLVKHYKKQYGRNLKVNISKKVEPLGKSWNKAIKNSSGEFLAIWNVDDLRTPRSLEKQLSLLINNKKLSLAYGPYKIVGKFQDTTGTLIDHRRISDFDFSRGMYAGPFFMFPRKVIKSIGFFDESLMSGADFDFVLRLLRIGQRASTSEILGYYLNAGQGLSTKPTSLQPIERTVVQMRYGLYETVDTKLIPYTNKYTIPIVYANGRSFQVRDLVPEYDSLYHENIQLFLKQKKMRKFFVTYFVQFYKFINRFFIRRGK